jgi:hypothetical protein
MPPDPSPRVLLLAAALALLAPPAHGEWAANGVPVCTAFGDQQSPLMVSDGVGGCYVVWQDGRGSSPSDVYAQRLTADGNPAPGWTLDGVPVCVAPGTVFSLGVAPDGEGGLLVAWGEWPGQFSEEGNVHAQRLLADGAVAPGWPVNGVPVSVQPGEQGLPTITGDGAGGAYIVWQDENTNPQEVYLQRLLADGTVAPGWPALGQPVCPIPARRGAPAPLATMEGGDVIVAYADARDAPADPGDIYAIRFTRSGTVAGGWPAEGISVCRAPGTIGVFGLALDGSGGVYVAWPDLRTTPPNDPYNTDYFNIYAQRVTGAGAIAAGWPTDGFPVCTAAHSQQEMDIAVDGAGGLLLSWSDYRDAFGEQRSDLYVQRLAPEGAVAAGWPANGKRGSTAPGYQLSTAIAPDGEGGAYVAFESLDGYHKIYAQHLTGSGTLAPGWPAAGTRLSTTTTSQQRPDLVSDGMGRAIAVWDDTRTSPNAYDIYAQRLGADGPTATLVSLASAEATAERVRLVWHSAEGAVSQGTVYRRTEQEEWRALGTTQADGSGALAFEDHAVSRGERYAYRLGYATADGEQLTAETWVVVPLAFQFALAAVHPHPVVDDLTVAYSLTSSASARLELYDISGRRVLTRELASQPGTFRLRVTEARALTAGIYWLRLGQGAQSASRRVVLIR